MLTKINRINREKKMLPSSRAEMCLMKSIWRFSVAGLTVRGAEEDGKYVL